MKKTDKKQRKEQSVAVQLPFPFEGMARESLLDAVILSGFGFVQEERSSPPNARELRAAGLQRSDSRL